MILYQCVGVWVCLICIWFRYRQTDRRFREETNDDDYFKNFDDDGIYLLWKGEGKSDSDFLAAFISDSADAGEYHYFAAQAMYSIKMDS